MKPCLAKLYARTMDLPEGAKDMETVRTLMAGLKAGPASLCHIFLVPSTRSCLLADIDAMLLLTEPDSVPTGPAALRQGNRTERTTALVCHVEDFM